MRPPPRPPALRPDGPGAAGAVGAAHRLRGPAARQELRRRPAARDQHAGPGAPARRLAARRRAPGASSFEGMALVEHLLMEGEVRMTVADYANAVKVYEKLVDDRPARGRVPPAARDRDGLLPAHAPSSPSASSTRPPASSPSNAEIHYQWGLYYKMMKVKSRAVAEMRTAVRLNPRHKAARGRARGALAEGHGADLASRSCSAELAPLPGPDRELVEEERASGTRARAAPRAARGAWRARHAHAAASSTGTIATTTRAPRQRSRAGRASADERRGAEDAAEEQVQVEHVDEQRLVAEQRQRAARRAAASRAAISTSSSSSSSPPRRTSA